MTFVTLGSFDGERGVIWLLRLWLGSWFGFLICWDLWRRLDLLILLLNRFDGVRWFVSIDYIHNVVLFENWILTGRCGFSLVGLAGLAGFWASRLVTFIL